MEDIGDLGPAMQALDERRRAFVRAYVNQARSFKAHEPRVGGGALWEPNAKEAVKAAGYGTPLSTDEYFRVQGHRLSHDERVQAAILEHSRREINLAAAVIATPVVISIALDEDAAPKERLRACEMLFNRGGMPAMTEHKVTVEHVDDGRMLEFVNALASELGVDRSKLLGENVKVIEHRPENVPQETINMSDGDE
jgi:hypothetical protein